MQKKTIVTRSAITALLLTGGFFFPLLFVAAAFVAWTILDGLQHPEHQTSNWTPSQALTTVNEGVSKLNSYVETAAAVQKAMGPSRNIFSKEKIAIEGSIQSALQRIKNDAFLLSKDDEYRRIYNNSIEKYKELLKDPTKEKYTMSIDAIAAPPAHLDPTINEAIKIGYQELLEERSHYFKAVRQRIKVDPRLQELVKAHLREIECSTTWDAIPS